MFLRNSLLSLLTAATSLNVAVASLDPIVIKGNKFFFQSNGSQFYIRGVAYQQDIGANGGGSTTASPTFIDPLANATNCQRDVPYLSKLGTNLVRTYAIDPTADHSECMSLLDDAGIYVLADLGSPQDSINRATPQWNTELFARYTSVVDAMQNYTNVMGFFAGNEVTNNLTNTPASAFVKAAVRDTKAYIKAKGYHPMGVGYAADDDATVRDQVADFMNCGDATDSIDFWGYNIYEWCGQSTFQTSGYQTRTLEFQNYTVPAFFAEYGCDTPDGQKPDAAARPWQEVGTLFGSQMNDVFSGGIAYEYFEEVNDFGLVTIDGSGAVSTLSDFNALATQISKSAYPTGVQSASFTPSNTVARSCPTIEANFWEAASSPLPPSPNADLCSCMLDSLTCTAKPGMSDEAAGELLNTVCTAELCEGIASNATTGKYGAYSMCNATQQIAFVFNAYYNSQSSANKGTACDFSGNATTQTAAKATGDCSSLLAQAGTAGTGSVSSSPTSGGSSASGGSSSSSGSASSKSSKGAAAGTFVPGIGAGWTTFIAMLVYLGGAGAVGVGMIWL